MIAHLVFWKLKSEANGKSAAENGAEMVRLLKTLPALVPQVRELNAGVDFNRSPAAWDVALYTTFENREDLQTYQDNPEHKKVVAFVLSVVESRAVVDYDL